VGTQGNESVEERANMPKVRVYHCHVMEITFSRNQLLTYSAFKTRNQKMNHSVCRMSTQSGVVTILMTAFEMMDQQNWGCLWNSWELLFNQSEDELKISQLWPFVIPQ
jgi:hypothetical protein